jgi:ankyrin repeat protein
VYDLEALRKRIQQAPDVLMNGPGSNTLIHLAARLGAVPALELLLADPDVQVDSTNGIGQTPLLVACVAGHYDAAMLLLSHGASAAKGDQKGDTALHWLCSFDAIRMQPLADALLKNNADIHAMSSRHEYDKDRQLVLQRGTPLHRAVGVNDIEAVKVLLELGADTLLPEPGQPLCTPLWIACTFHNHEILGLLLENVGDSASTRNVVNGGKSEEWPLMKPVVDIGYYYLLGATWGRMVRHHENYRLAVRSTIRKLRQAGAHMWLSSQSKFRLTALAQAVMLRCSDVVEAVLEECPDLVNVASGLKRDMPLHHAVVSDREDIVHLMLAHGADVFAKQADDVNAIGLYATYRGRLEIPRILYQKGLGIEIPSTGHETPFFSAVKNRAFDLAIWILEKISANERAAMINAFCSYGPSFKFPRPGVSILGYLLVENSMLAVRPVKFLFSLQDTYGRVNFEAFPSEGKSALRYLASYNRHIRDNAANRALAVEILKYFSSAEEIDLADSKTGRTALMEAVGSLNYDMIDLLLDKRASATTPSSDGQTPLQYLSMLISHATEHHQGGEVIEKLREVERLFQSYGYSLSGQAGETE